MAIFKILKGASSRINFDVTPFTEGYAYFTPDDSGFYIDAKVDENNKRIRINPKSVSVDKILLSSGWEDGKQTVTVDGLGAGQNGHVGLSQNATSEEVKAAAKAGLRLCDQAEGKVTVAADGNIPGIDIPISITMLF